MDLLVLLAEGLYVLLFVATLRAFVQRRDPVSRDLALVFSALAVLFVLQTVRQVAGSVPVEVNRLAGALFLLQPVFALHLVSLVRPVPRWLLWVSAVLAVGTSLPVLVLMNSTSGSSGSASTTSPEVRALSFLAIGVFIAIEAIAASYLLQVAVRRTGPVAVRMGLAAISTLLFALALFAAIVASIAGTAPDVSRFTAAGLALLAGIGYLFAFLPPRLFRRALQARTTVDYNQALIARSTEPVDAIWRGFADMAIRLQGGAAVMLTGPRNGSTAIAATAGLPSLDAFEPMPWSEFDARLARVDSPWDVPVDRVGPLRRQLAELAGARFVTVVPITVPASEERAALVLLSSHRTLFHPSDADLLSALGAQTAIVAERRAFVAEQEALSDRLALTVEALKSASAAKSDFVASMSHEFRTPLSAIIGFSDLMATEPRDGTNVSVPIEWVEHIQRGGQHLLALVNDVLDLAKVEAGRLDLRLEPVDVGHAVIEAVNGLRPLADRKNLVLETDVAQTIVDADRGRFRQILYNLISNAIKYTPDGGSIRVVGTVGGGDVRIAVVDTGVGIAPEEHERVFEEFRQVGDPSERQPGSGLGLAVTKRLAEAHGGRIELESARGKGSTFTLVLPGTAGEATATSPDVAASAAGTSEAGTGDILVIEDDPSAVRLLREYLEGAGYGIRIAATGENGIAMAAAQRPAAIVLDVLLPGIDGWEVLRRLKADEHLAGVPVVIVTVIEEREIGLALGAVDYLVKPIYREALLGCISRYVAANSGRTSPRRVLVVDDEPASLALIRGALEPEGVEVVTAQGGREALEWAEHGEMVDMVVCDLVMPDVDGFEVIAALKQNERTSSLPIVVCTAHDLTSDQKAKLNGHILGIVAKGQNARVGLLDWLKHAVPVLLP